MKFEKNYECSYDITFSRFFKYIVYCGSFENFKSKNAKEEI